MNDVFKAVAAVAAGALVATEVAANEKGSLLKFQGSNEFDLEIQKKISYEKLKLEEMQSEERIKMKQLELNIERQKAVNANIQIQKDSIELKKAQEARYIVQNEILMARINMIQQKGDVKVG